MTTDKQQPQVPANFKFSDSYWQAFVASCQPPEPPSPQAAQAREEAVAFAHSLGERLTPAEREGLIATLTQDGLDDVALGAITFANGQQGSRVEQTKALYGATPRQAPTQREYTNEELLMMTPGGRKALELKKKREAAFSRAGMDPERRRLLEMTPLGRQALDRIVKENGG